MRKCVRFIPSTRPYYIVKSTINYTLEVWRGWECRSHLGEYAAKPLQQGWCFVYSKVHVFSGFTIYNYSLDNFIFLVTESGKEVILSE